MRRTTWAGIAAALAIGLVTTTGGCGHEQKNTSTAASPAAKGDSAGGANTSASAGKICNAPCPVAGDPVDPGVQTVDYDGKTWGFCCDSCVAPFKKDPAKYVAKYEKEHPDQK